MRFDDAEPGEAMPNPDLTQDQVIDQIIRVEMVVVEWRRARRTADTLTGAGRETDEVDLAKVDMWIVAGETWKENRKPLRYRVQRPEAIQGLDPQHGGTVVLAGHLHGITVLEPQVIAEIGGDVQELEVVKVLPDRVTDAEVGGFELDPHGKPWNQPLGVGDGTLGE